MNLQSYFARTGYTGATEPTLPVLAELLRAHIFNVPFEALDVQLGRPLTIDAEAAFEKIVTRKRGGWCYEQNGLFHWALSEIGFEVTRVAAAVGRLQRGSIADANHLTLLVRTADTDSTWLADVGFGGSIIAPIELQEAEHHQEPFRVGLRQLADGYWQFWEDLDDSEFCFDFLPEPADESELTARCHFLQTDPESGFVQNLVAQIRLPDVHNTLRGRVFSQASADSIETRLLESADELVSLLRDTFALDVPEVADLWPAIERRHEELVQQGVLTNTYEIRSRSHDQPLS